MSNPNGILHSPPRVSSNVLADKGQDINLTLSLSFDQRKSTHFSDDDGVLTKDSYVSMDEEDDLGRCGSALVSSQRYQSRQSVTKDSAGGKKEKKESDEMPAESYVSTTSRATIKGPGVVKANGTNLNRRMYYFGAALVLVFIFVIVVVFIFILTSGNHNGGNNANASEGTVVLPSSSTQPTLQPSPRPLTPVLLPRSSTQPNMQPSPRPLTTVLLHTSSTQPTMQPSPRPLTLPQTFPGTSPNAQELLKLLTPLARDGGASLRDSSAIQYSALQWLASDDLFFIYSDQRKVQRYAMATLYYGLIGEQWWNKSGWLIERDECLWANKAAVSCNSDGMVIAIDSQDNNVAGSIPPELGLLSGLEVLELQGNKILGTIPEELYNLRSLQKLNLASNILTGSLSTNLGNLGSLTYFSVSNNSLIGPLPSEIGQLSNVGIFGVGNNSLTGTLPTSIGQMTSLSVISLQNNHFSGPLPSEIALLNSLNVIYIGTSDITGPFPENIFST